MSLSAVQLIIGFALIAGETPRPAPNQAPSLSESICLSDHVWWLPNVRCCKNRDSFLSPLELPDVEVRSPAGESLIEEAADILRSPTQRPRDAAGLILERHDPLPLRNDQFRIPWRDGAPLLLFDWTGASGSPLGIHYLKTEGAQRVAKAKTDMEWADLSSKIKMRDADFELDPGVRHAWESDETVKLPVAGSMFVFGQLGASSSDAEQRQITWVTKTGVGFKVRPWLLQEVQVRGGPAVRHDDSIATAKNPANERSELFLEAVAKLPLPIVGPLNVEYTSYTIPSVNPTERNLMNQDVRFAKPFSAGGEVHFGAKYRWDANPSATPWMDRMGVYLGVQNKW